MLGFLEIKSHYHLIKGNHLPQLRASHNYFTGCWNRNTLISFGIPGIILFTLGYLLSRDVIGSFDEINSVSLGVALATFVVTIVGLLAIMSSIILYILGKQVEQIQLQYQEWPQE